MCNCVSVGPFFFLILLITDRKDRARKVFAYFLALWMFTTTNYAAEIIMCENLHL
jgi:hypothetical protein